MRRLALVAAPLVFAVACVTAPEPTAAPPPAPPPPADLDAARLCRVTAEVADAMARLKLRETQARLEKEAAGKKPGAREALFGAHLAIQNDQDRFRAFHDETRDRPDSALGPLGECFVYAEWKMADQADAPCARAAAGLHHAAIVDVARATLKRRTQELAAASGLIESALAREPGCAAAHMEAARIQEAAGDAARARDAWERALKAMPTCATCAVEVARSVEAQEDRAAAAAAWERALVIAPDHGEALKHYGAALAGSDPAKALLAYERALAAGKGDAHTFLAAAQLARAVDADKALAFAERATKEQKNDVDAWRLILAIASQKGDEPRAEGAAREVLRLVEEDVPAHLVVARAAQKRGDLVAAVDAFDAAARALAAGRGEPLPADAVAAAVQEHKELLKQLHVKESGAKGSKEAVVSAVRRTVQGVFAERLKKNKGMKGAIDVNVVTVEGGAVSSVEIEKDTLGDAHVAGSVVANLRRANIAGGAKRYGFTLEFE